MYPEDWFALASNGTLAVVEPFVQELEAFLGVQRTSINTSALWDETSGIGIPIATYLNTVHGLPDFLESEGEFC